MGEENGLHIADTGHPKDIMPAHNRHIRHEGRRLGVGDDRTEQRLDAFAHTVIAENIFRTVVGEDQLAEAAQHCWFSGEGQNLGWDLYHTKQPPL